MAFTSSMWAMSSCSLASCMIHDRQRIRLPRDSSRLFLNSPHRSGQSMLTSSLANPRPRSRLMHVLTTRPERMVPAAVLDRIIDDAGGQRRSVLRPGKVSILYQADISTHEITHRLSSVTELRSDYGGLSARIGCGSSEDEPHRLLQGRWSRPRSRLPRVSPIRAPADRQANESASSAGRSATEPARFSGRQTNEPAGWRSPPRSESGGACLSMSHPW